MRLTEEQKVFRRELRDYLQENVAPVADELNENGPVDRETLLEFMDDLNELGIGFDPDTAQTFFGDVWRYAITSEEISRVWGSLNVSLLMSFPAIFVRFAGDPTREAMLPKLERGECLGSLAVTEPSGGSDTARPKTTARKDGDEFVINGQKTWVGNAHLRGRLSGGRTRRIDRCTGHVPDGPRERVVRNRGTRQTQLEGRLEREDYLRQRARPGEQPPLDYVQERHHRGADMDDIVPFPESVTQLFFDQKPLNATFSFMRTGMSFMAVGIMQAAFDEAVEYATDRETFGNPIAQHQLVQEKLYDMQVGLETSRQLSQQAAELLEDGSSDARLMSSLAKGYTSETSKQVTDDAIQVFGAEGLKTENRLERYYRDARVMTIPDGTTEIQKLIVGKELTGMSAYN